MKVLNMQFQARKAEVSIMKSRLERYREDVAGRVDCLVVKSQDVIIAM